MIKKVNTERTARGQTALVLILLTAAAMIFLAITLNWGRIAQEKSMLSIAADQAASLLASDVASYGEMNKQTYLQNTNSITELGGFLMAIIMIIVAIIVLIITICTYGGTSPLLALAIAAVVAAFVNLVLQVVVVQPGITTMWNKLQKNQPIVQQFEEGGIGAALQGGGSDQANVTDYFDWNANGVLGVNSSGAPKDTVSRFAVFYTDRLKMFNEALPVNPQVTFFYNQLGEFVNGETCGQNQADNNLYPSIITINSNCEAAGVFPINPDGTTAGINCTTTPGDPVCEMKVPGGFQLSDACVSSSNSTNTATYNPYCDPCCQVLNVPNPAYNPSANPPNPLQPQFKSIRPPNCPSDVSAECGVNNPYGSSYSYIYDPTYQNYADQVSFLAQFGRDQQSIPPASVLPLTALTPQGSANNGMYFPNGVYPFFWEMNDYSPQVDKINPAITAIKVPQQHWCTSSTSGASGYISPTGFPSLAQLTLPYTCSGQDCCVNFLPDVVNNIGTGTAGITIIVGSSTTPQVTISSSGGKTDSSGDVIFQVGSSVSLSATATETSGGFTNGSFYSSGAVVESTTPSPSPSGSSYTFTFSPAAGGNTAGTYAVYAQATDTYNVVANSPTLNVIIANQPTVSLTGPGTVTSGSTVTLTATASEAGGTISSVALSGVAGLGACTGSGGSYSCTWTVPPELVEIGYSIKATATDSYGFTAISSSVTGNIEPPTGTGSGTGT